MLSTVKLVAERVERSRQALRVSPRRGKPGDLLDATTQ
jgi:hypothetical protein